MGMIGQNETWMNRRYTSERTTVVITLTLFCLILLWCIAVLVSMFVTTCMLMCYSSHEDHYKRQEDGVESLQSDDTTHRKNDLVLKVNCEIAAKQATHSPLHSDGEYRIGADAYDDGDGDTIDATVAALSNRSNQTLRHRQNQTRLPVDEFDEDPCDQDCKNCFGSLCIVALALGQIVPFACIFCCLV